ncbi:MAG TPA: hypothetical protein VI479_22715, partial [Blastocatellia bacterium]
VTGHSPFATDDSSFAFRHWSLVIGHRFLMLSHAHEMPGMGIGPENAQCSSSLNELAPAMANDK